MAEQQGFAEALGIDSSLISMLRQTSAETEKLKQRARDLGITLSPEDIKGLKEYNESISEMGAALSGLKNLIAVAIVPELEDLAEGFSDLLAKNNEWLVDGVEATVEFVVDLVDALKRLAPFILTAGAAFYHSDHRHIWVCCCPWFPNISCRFNYRWDFSYRARS